MKLLIIGNVGFDLMAPYLKAEGVETVIADTTGNGLNTELADKSYLLDPPDWEPLAEVALAERVAAVISISGPDHRNLRDSHLKEYLEREHAIPTLANPLPAARIAVDKGETKRWLARNGFPVTAGRTVVDAAEARQVALSLGVPVVVKSLADSGGVGLQVIRGLEDLLQLKMRSYPALIEKFVAGPEFSVEVLNFNGEALPLLPVYKGCTNLDAIHPMERVKLAPAPLDAVDTARLRRLAKEIVQGLDLQPTADVDIVWGDNGPQVLEINPRFGGVTALSMAASGVLVYWSLVDMVFGRWHPATTRLMRGFAADIPIPPAAAHANIGDILDSEGVFRIKIQKLKRTLGRIALVAEEPRRLLEIAQRVRAADLCEDGVLHELNALIELAVA